MLETFDIKGNQVKKSKWCSLLLLLLFFFLHGSYLMSSITPSPLQFFQMGSFSNLLSILLWLGQVVNFWFWEFFHCSAVERLAESFHLSIIAENFGLKSLILGKIKNAFHFDHGVLSQGFLQFLAFHHSFVYEEILCFTKSVLWDFVFLSSFNNLKGIVGFFFLFVSFLFWINE
jgi:hypothetical protein